MGTVWGNSRCIHAILGIRRHLWHLGSDVVGQVRVQVTRYVLVLVLPVVAGWGVGFGLGAQSCWGRCGGFALPL